MHRGYRYLSSIFLLAALAVPAAVRTNARQNDKDDKNKGAERWNDKDQKRVYDPVRRDRHDWNDKEERAYRQYLTENHKDYREFSKANRKEQKKYWNWRHSHPDQPDHTDGDQGKN